MSLFFAWKDRGLEPILKQMFSKHLLAGIKLAAAL